MAQNCRNVEKVINFLHANLFNRPKSTYNWKKRPLHIMFWHVMYEHLNHTSNTFVCDTMEGTMKIQYNFATNKHVWLTQLIIKPLLCLCAFLYWRHVGWMSKCKLDSHRLGLEVPSTYKWHYIHKGIHIQCRMENSNMVLTVMNFLQVWKSMIIFIINSKEGNNERFNFWIICCTTWRSNHSIRSCTCPLKPLLYS
jgi:hypothetical protein